MDQLQSCPVGLQRLLVKVTQGLQHLEDRTQLQRQRRIIVLSLALHGKALLVRPSFEQLHDEIREATGIADLDGLHDVGMLQLRGDLRLLQKHRNE